jgi:ADP-L-glycero-D-manno-heptose 6-epimerase
MRIIVTGGTGFIGSNLCQVLKEQGNEVCTTGLEESAIIRKFQDIKTEKLSTFDALVHLAAITSTTNYNEEEVEKVNYRDAISLFNKAASAGIKKIVYASSCAVYGNASHPFTELSPLQPLNAYARSKAKLDRAALQCKNTSIVGLRFSNVYGCGERHKKKAASMIYQIYQQAKTGEVTLFQHGEQLRDWVYVKDAVSGIVKALQTDISGIFNIGSGVAVSFNTLIHIFEYLLGQKIQVKYIENPYAQVYQNYTLVKLSESLGYVPCWSVIKGIEDCIAKDFVLENA